MVANALKKSKSNIAVGEKNVNSSDVIGNFCELLRRFLQLNNNMKIPLFESLGVSEIRKIYGKYFEFHMSLAIQEARTFLDESIISIEKTSSSNTLSNSY